MEATSIGGSRCARVMTLVMTSASSMHIFAARAHFGRVLALAPENAMAQEALARLDGK